MNGIADMGFLVSFASTSDKHDTWAAQIAASVTELLLTCLAVLAARYFIGAPLRFPRARFEPLRRRAGPRGNSTSPAYRQNVP